LPVVGEYHSSGALLTLCTPTQCRPSVGNWNSDDYRNH